MRIDAVPRKPFNILQRLMDLKSLSGFALGGGTSLALRFGHRRSVDIDLFSPAAFNTEVLLNAVRTLFGQTEIHNRTEGSLSVGILGVKVDILHDAYDLLEAPSLLDEIRVLSLADIAAMKVNAITNRGSKKDFSDLLLLHRNRISLSQALDHFCSKYGEGGRFLAIRSLQFFDDARKEPDPNYLNGWTWELVEQDIDRLARALNR